MTLISILIAWAAAAFAAGYSGVLLKLPTMAPQLCIVILTLLVLGSYFLNGKSRRAIESLSPRALLLPHLGRFVGIYFLYLYQQGCLPEAFAIRGGWGDIIAATGATILMFLPLTNPKARLVLLLWNVIGVIDIGLVVAMAIRANLANPASMNELRHLPLSLLPTWLVPLIISTHIIIFYRLFHRGSQPAE